MERSYRFALLKCGLLSQNLLLNAISFERKSLPAAAFIDDKINNIFKLDTLHSNI